MASPIHQIEEVALDSTGDMVTGSLAHRVYLLSRRIQGIAKVYPTLADGATVVTANADWTLGAFATVVPANTITNDYFIKHVNVSSCDQNAVFELVLYYGAGDTEAGRVRFAVSGGFWGNAAYLVETEDVPANSQVRAKVASSDGLANQATLTISIGYIEYD